MTKTGNNSEFEACKVSTLLQKLYCDSTLGSQKRLTTGYKYMDRLIDGPPSSLAQFLWQNVNIDTLTLFAM